MSEIASALFQVLETTLDKALVLTPRLREGLAALDGKIVKITVTDLPLSIVCIIQADKIKLYAQFDAVPDVHIRASSKDLLKMMLDKDVNFFDLDLDISGDMDLAQDFQAVFNEVHFDVQDLAHQILGESWVNTIGAQFSGLMSAFKSSTNELNIIGKSTLEESMVASKTEVKDFVTKVDALHAQVDRLSARISGTGIKG